MCDKGFCMMDSGLDYRVLTLESKNREFESEIQELKLEISNLKRH